jgi:hypothetical protein
VPAPGSQPKRAAIPWNPAAPYKGFGFRQVEADVDHAKYDISEFPVVKGTFEFHCDNFCGIDHEHMNAAIIVESETDKGVTIGGLIK